MNKMENGLFRKLSHLPSSKHIYFLVILMALYFLFSFLGNMPDAFVSIFFLLQILYIYIFTLTGLYFSSRQSSRRMMQNKRIKLGLIVVIEILIFMWLWMDPEGYYASFMPFRLFMNLFPLILLVLEWSGVKNT